MRETKFRGFSEELNKWVYGDLVNDIISKYIIPIESIIWRDSVLNENGIYDTKIRVIAHKVIPESICRYTGLKDKKGFKIYEKDFYREIYSDGSGERICLVEYKEHISLPSFDKYIGFQIDYDRLHNIEVIGNVFENQELLK